MSYLSFNNIVIPFYLCTICPTKFGQITIDSVSLLHFVYSYFLLAHPMVRHMLEM